MANFQLSEIEDALIREKAAYIVAVDEDVLKYQRMAGDTREVVTDLKLQLHDARVTLRRNPTQEALFEAVRLQRLVVDCEDFLTGNPFISHLEFFGQSHDEVGSLFQIHRDLEDTMWTFLERLREVLTPILEQSQSMDAENSAKLETADPIRSQLTAQLNGLIQNATRLLQKRDRRDFREVASIAREIIEDRKNCSCE